MVDLSFGLRPKMGRQIKLWSQRKTKPKNEEQN